MFCPACQGRKVIHQYKCKAPIFKHIPKQRKKKCCDFRRCDMCSSQGSLSEGDLWALFRTIDHKQQFVPPNSGGGWRLDSAG